MSEASTELERLPSPGAVPALAYQPAAILTDDEITRVWRIASALAQSGMHSTLKDASEAFAKILLGRDLGLSAMQALMSIDFVKGSPMIRGVTLLSFVRKHPLYDYRVLEHTEEKAVLRFLRDDGEGLAPFADEEYTIAMAEAANLIPTDHRSPWWTARPNMLLWRCASNGVKFHCPDLLGGVPVYTEGDAFVESRDGDVEQIGAAPAIYSDNEGIIDALLVPKPLRENVKAALREHNDLEPGSFTPAKVQMIFTAQPADVVVARYEEILRSIEALRSDEPSVTATESTAVEVPLPPDATAPPKDARPAPADFVAVGEEEDDNPVCPVCDRNWLDHNEEQKDSCQAAADAETA